MWNEGGELHRLIVDGDPFGFVAAIKVREYRADFRIVSVFSRSMDGDEVTYGDSECESNDPFDAPWEVDGFVKWDGCGHIQTNPECMLHLCGRHSAQDLADILPAIWDAASRHVPHWNHEAAGTQAAREAADER